MSIIYVQIARERLRQEELKKEGRFRYTCADMEMTHADKATVLVEEVGEVCGAVIQLAGIGTDRPNADLRKELLHVAAVAVAWIESIDKEAEYGKKTTAAP